MMNCNEALELLLEADPEAMEGRGELPVAAHVRDCARCRAVAARLLADTAVLARYAERPVTRPAWVPRSAIAGAALAAATLILVVRTGGERAGGVVAVPDTVFSTIAARAPEVLDSAPIPARARGPERTHRREVATQLRRFAEPVAATPVRFVASQPVAAVAVVPESALVTVTPAQGTRAFVLKTRNPGITVVWLER